MSRGSPKATVAAKLLDEARGLSGDFDRLSQTVAAKVGLTQTDLLAIDLISRDNEVTAGQLARELNLTTGAITGLIDRLQKAGLARRVDDPNDRRRVLVGRPPRSSASASYIALWLCACDGPSTITPRTNSPCSPSFCASSDQRCEPRRNQSADRARASRVLDARPLLGFRLPEGARRSVTSL